MSAGCNNPYRAEAQFTCARAKMPGLWFIFRGEYRIAEAWSEANARMITDALNATQ
jgi:hypothetical protein